MKTQMYDLSLYILTHPHPAVSDGVTADEGSADSSSFGAGWRAGDMQTTPLLAGNATRNLLCHRLGSKGGEIMELLYFFSSKTHLRVVSTLQPNSGMEGKFVLGLFMCPAKMGSCTMAFMTKNSDADISGKGKSQRVFCWYMSCRLKC